MQQAKESTRGAGKSPTSREQPSQAQPPPVVVAEEEEMADDIGPWSRTGRAPSLARSDDGDFGGGSIDGQQEQEQQASGEGVSTAALQRAFRSSEATWAAKDAWDWDRAASAAKRGGGGGGGGGGGSGSSPAAVDGGADIGGEGGSTEDGQQTTQPSSRRTKQKQRQQQRRSQAAAATAATIPEGAAEAEDD
eukprot:COSAG05_NODE_1749_length_4148_cov_2.414423_2_plen_192_part_00